MNKTKWKLYDYYETVGEKEEFPEYVIRSAAGLRSRLRSFVSGPERIVELYSPNEDFLRIGIGGRYAGVAWIHLPTVKILVAADPVATASVVFEIQGQPCTLDADELHPPENIIGLACHYFLHGAVPTGLTWRDVS